MKIRCQPEHPFDEAATRAATGRSLGEWFSYLDAFDALAKGRREVGNHLAGELKIDPWWATTINNEYEAAHGVREKDGRLKGYTICATKSVKASAETCSAAFASADQLDRWLGPGHQLDFRDGGSLSNADGNRAEIRKINPGKTIRLIWQQADAAPDTPVEVKFATSAGKTTVMITHERLQTRAEADGLRAAWGEALTQLKQLLEE